MHSCILASRVPVRPYRVFPQLGLKTTGNDKSLGVRTSMGLPCKRLLRWFKARHTVSNSRQLMYQCSWGPVQTPDTAKPLNVAPQPENHNMPGDLFQGHSSNQWTGGGSSCLPRKKKDILNRNVRLLKSTFISMHSILGWASFCMNYCMAWMQSACGTAQV